MESKEPSSVTSWIRQQADEVVKPSSTNIEYFLGEGEVDKEDKYTMFMNWCHKEGMYMPKLEYPAFFEGGLLGVRCKEDIDHREVYLYVPYKMLMSVKSTQDHAVLQEMLKAHPECFGEDDCEDWE